MRDGVQRRPGRERDPPYHQALSQFWCPKCPYITRHLLQVSRLMGQSFGAEDWASALFAEEVVRGGPAFAVSLVVSSVEPVLRNSAALGAWQVCVRAEKRDL